MLIAFLPALFLAAKYWPALVVAGIGALYVIGRHLYWRAYVSDPAKRAFGFVMSMLPTGALLGLALIGIGLMLIRG